ncbi:hypothetical protein O3G_MSEX001440 [Manduca sexta]|uniref:Uncharacterized protein n=2 Tax=Manduca sexta TaxID=7130 RepID=A0A921YKB7_MANSE|nr:hypothetical protein O3G_MSEX001440 [Manduca sexta]KAG6440836.1 hypothetical protein O3G_MSEX001440 [Manduca sexta]
MKLFLLILGVTLAVCEDTSSSSSVHWEKSTQYAYVNGKPVNLQIDPVKIVKDPKLESSSEPAKADDEKVDKNKDAADPAKLRYPSFYPGRYPYPDLYPYPYPQLDPGFAGPSYWNQRPVIPYDRSNEDQDFHLREE